jgi:hypothetical protein
MKTEINFKKIRNKLKKIDTEDKLKIKKGLLKTEGLKGG